MKYRIGFHVSKRDLFNTRTLTNIEKNLHASIRQ